MIRTLCLTSLLVALAAFVGCTVEIQQDDIDTSNLEKVVLKVEGMT